MPLESDPVCLLLTADGDIDLTGGKTRFASGMTAVVQGARARMALIRGEWFLDPTVGVPYFERDNIPPSQALLGQTFDAVKVRTAMRKAILSTPGITDILSLAVEQEPITRTITVTWSAKTVFGDTPADVIEG